jgi:hypothetical protein
VVFRPQTKEEWEQQEAADRADGARLTKKLRICTGCSAAPARPHPAVVMDGNVMPPNPPAPKTRKVKKAKASKKKVAKKPATKKTALRK